MRSRSASRDLFDLSAFLLATSRRIDEVLAVIWREVDLLAGELEVARRSFASPGAGFFRKSTKSDADERVLQLPMWCVALLVGG